MTRTVTSPYDVAEHLRTPDETAAYLEACMEEVQRDWLLCLQVQVLPTQFSVWHRSDIRQALGVTR